MKVNDFYKELKKLVKQNNDIAAYINYYESGMITFTECLRNIQEIENKSHLQDFTEGNL